MLLKGKLTPRRKLLLAIMAVLLLAVAWAGWAGMAATRGIETADMDWNEDGTVTRTEIAQSLYAVTASRENTSSSSPMLIDGSTARPPTSDVAHPTPMRPCRSVPVRKATATSTSSGCNRRSRSANAWILAVRERVAPTAAEVATRSATSVMDAS